MLPVKSAKFLVGALVLITAFSLFSLSNSFCSSQDKRKTQAQAHYMMGLFYENQEKFDEAIPEYGQAGALEKDISAIHLHLGSVFMRKGDFKKAAEELEEAKKLGAPEDLDAGLMLGLIYSAQNSQDKAAREYEEVLKKAAGQEPKNIYILKSLAAVYYQQKKIENAISTYKLILDIDKNNYEAIFLLGSLLEESGMRLEAINKFKEALSLNPGYPEALNSLGYVYAEGGENLSEAEDLIKKALLAEPDNGAYIDSLGWVYFKKDLTDKAIEQLEKASALLSDPVIYEHLGEAYLKNGFPDKAGSAWEKSLELDSGQEKVREKLNRLKNK